MMRPSMPCSWRRYSPPVRTRSGVQRPGDFVRRWGSGKEVPENADGLAPGTIGMSCQVSRKVALMCRDGSTGAGLEFGGGTEVVDMPVRDDDHLQIGGIDARGSDSVPDAIAAGGHAAID